MTVRDLSPHVFRMWTKSALLLLAAGAISACTDMDSPLSPAAGDPGTALLSTASGSGGFSFCAAGDDVRFLMLGSEDAFGSTPDLNPPNISGGLAVWAATVPNIKGVDDPRLNRRVVHRFEFEDIAADLTGARLRTLLRPSGYARNDNLDLRIIEDDGLYSTIWVSRIGNDGSAPGLQSSAWDIRANPGLEFEAVLDLSDLPFRRVDRPTDFLPVMRDRGFLDFHVQDDTEVDFAELLLCSRPPNVAPVVTSITLPTAPVPVGSSTSLTATFTDDNPNDVHTADIFWGDVTTAGAVTESGGSGTISGSHTFAAPGVYTVTVSVSDEEFTGTRSSALDTPAYIVVYDPSAGFITGGGWIDSPEAAYTPDSSLSGRASFGFVSKYKRGASTPHGNIEFQFGAGDLNFRSTSYDWLVIAGARGQFKGEGTINGQGTYGFILTSIDGEVDGAGGADRFRIKIWDKAAGDEIVYDNQMGSSEVSDDGTGLGGGSVVIHTRGNGRR